MENFYELSINEINSLIIRGKLSSLQLSKSILKRIYTYDKFIKSFTYINEKEIFERAIYLDEELENGRSNSDLHGVPISIKDAFDIINIPTTVGSRLFLDYFPSKNSEVITKLLNAGSVIIGKTETTEFCFGGPSLDSAFSPAKNPWNINRWTGGSSGGGAAAVAAQFCFGSIGTDTGGSVRLPAAWCGLVGFMPTPGNISRDGVFELSKSLDCVGVLAKSIADAIIINNQISEKINLVPTSKFLCDKKIAIASDFLNNADKEVSDTFFAVRNKIEECGYFIEDISGLDLKHYAAVQAIITVFEAYHRYKKYLNNKIQLGFFTRSRLSLGAFVSFDDYKNALVARKKCIDQYNRIMDDYDIMILPSALTLAPEVNAKDPFLFLNKPLPTTIANVVGVPSVVVPWNIVGGLPTSVQLIGKKQEDQAMIDFAFVIENLRKDWKFPKFDSMLK